MEINFDLVIPTILKQEGGFTDDPNDDGGATNYGLSLRFLKTIYPHADREFVKNLTKEQAISIYREHFWEDYNYKYITDLSLATKVFSLAVTSGHKTAAICLQRTLRALEILVKEDGIFGNVTLEAINTYLSIYHPSYPGSYIYCLVVCIFRSEMAAYYRLIAAKKPSKREYLEGWLNRAYS